MPTAHPISVSPSDTREFLLNSLALCVLYSVVINNVVSSAAFMRLAWVCAINGTAVSLLAFAQQLSSPTHVIYWSIVVGGTPFGPFDYRNVFPFFANVCIGLSLGLLIAAAQKRRRVLENAKALWLFSFVVVTLTAVAFSMSRGGMISILVAISLGGVFWLRSRHSRSHLGLLLWIGPAVLMVVSWIGWSALEQRFERLADKSVKEGRFDVWRDSLKQFTQFPVFGVGNGAFEHVEPITRQTTGVEWVANPHAHNEYVEAIVEGGVIRLALTIALIWVVSASGIQNYRRLEGRSLGWLVLGGLIGFWAVALHSFVDFGIHYPAIAMVGVVLVAHIVTARINQHASDRFELPLAICLVVAAGMLVLGGLLVWEGYVEDQAARFRNAAVLEARSQDPGAPARRVTLLEEAVHCRPEQFRYRDELSQAYLITSRSSRTPIESEKQLLESLKQAISERDLCPLLVRPNMQLGLYGNHLAKAEPPERYFERALRSFPTNPTIWFASGKRHYDIGEWEKAWSDWRRSLELSIRHFEGIYLDAKERLSPVEFLEKVLPEKADVIYYAVDQIYPENAASASLRRPFVAKALLIYDRAGPDRTAREQLFRGRLLRQLGRFEESVATLRSAMAKDPSLLECRWEIVHEYYDYEMFAEAKKELELILIRNPRDAVAKDFLDQVNRELVLAE